MRETKNLSKKTRLKFFHMMLDGLAEYEGKKLFYHSIKNWSLKNMAKPENERDPEFIEFRKRMLQEKK